MRPTLEGITGKWHRSHHIGPKIGHSHVTSKSRQFHGGICIIGGQKMSLHVRSSKSEEKLNVPPLGHVPHWLLLSLLIG